MQLSSQNLYKKVCWKSRLPQYGPCFTLIHRAYVIYDLHLLDWWLTWVKTHEKQILQRNFVPGKNLDPSLSKNHILEIYLYQNFGAICYKATLWNRVKNVKKRSASSSGHNAISKAVGTSTRLLLSFGAGDKANLIQRANIHGLVTANRSNSKCTAWTVSLDLQFYLWNLESMAVTLPELGVWRHIFKHRNMKKFINMKNLYKNLISISSNNNLFGLISRESLPLKRRCKN
jgi:hypothetical protein